MWRITPVQDDVGLAVPPSPGPLPGFLWQVGVGRRREDQRRRESRRDGDQRLGSRR